MSNVPKCLEIAYLYPREMSTYGDLGNVLCLQRRLEWRGYSHNTIEVHPGDKPPKHADMIFMGGGQDSGQRVIESSLQDLSAWLHEAVDAGIPGLMICGAYQLLGHYFETQDGYRIDGIGVFDAHTVAGTDRRIGNVVVHSSHFGEVIGFENHSGNTHIQHPRQALGTVPRGQGNNGKDHTEGILHKNFVGTYLHGPLLPKNPMIADWLLATALGISSTELVQLDDKNVAQARRIAARRPR